MEKNFKKSSNIKLAHFIIIDEIKADWRTNKELQAILKRHQIKVEMRTILRYIKEIEEVFDFNIEHKNNHYRIYEQPNKSNLYSVFKSAIIPSNIFELLAYKPALVNHIELDFQNSAGFEYISSMLQAIEGKMKVRIEYQSYRSTNIEEYIIRPYLLKSYLNRYYIIGVVDNKPSKYERFSLDKIKSIETLDQIYDDYDLQKVKDFYNEVLGVTTYDDAPPIQEVRLKFLKGQFKYFKSEPWVENYNVINTNSSKDEVIISFNVRRNNDLSQRILSYTDKVRVLQPKEVVDDVKDFLQKALNLYK